MAKITRENISDHLLEYQLAFANKTLQEAKDNPNWLKEWSISRQDYDKFKEYAVMLIKKVFRCNTNRAKGTFAWFDLQFGLTVKEEEINKP